MKFRGTLILTLSFLVPSLSTPLLAQQRDLISMGAFAVKHIPAEDELEQEREPVMGGGGQPDEWPRATAPDPNLDIPTPKVGKKPAKELDLPKDLVNRVFLYNTANYRNRLNDLVGMVCKKQVVDGKEVMTPLRDYKLESTFVQNEVPSNGMLLEMQLDHTYGAQAQFLIGGVKMEKSEAYQLIVSDVLEASLQDEEVDVQALKDRFAEEEDLDAYYLIRGATTTSVLRKKFNNSEANANTSAISVGGEMFFQSSEITQDWLVGMQLVELVEFIK